MKVAAVQMDVKIFQKERNLEQVLSRLREAARAGAKLIIFPECALTGYCFETLEEAIPLAETVPGPSTEKLAAATKELGCTAVVGLLERDGGGLYNSAAVVGPHGPLGSYRKIHLPGLGLDLLATAGDKPYCVVETPQARFGINICFDCSFPEPARVLKLRGGQILAIPTNWPLGSDSWLHTVKTRAIENHMIVVAADRVGEERGFRFAGHSQIINFTGDVLAEAGETEETILVADVEPAGADNNRVVRIPGKWEFDRIASRRPEMYGAITEPRARKAEVNR